MSDATCRHCEKPQSEHLDGGVLCADWGYPEFEPGPTYAQLEAALTKISAVRDSIVGMQGFNFSEHAYPLVAALDEVGFKGAGHKIARENLGTLIEQIEAAEAVIAKLLKLDDERPIDPTWWRRHWKAAREEAEALLAKNGGGKP